MDSCSLSTKIMLHRVYSQINLKVTLELFQLEIYKEQGILDLNGGSRLTMTIYCNMITVINESHGLFILHITQERSGFMKKESISFSMNPNLH